MEFFLPDGNGGALDNEEAEKFYADLKSAHCRASFWPSDSFTERRVHSIASDHTAGSFYNSIGERNIEGWTALAILESRDDHGRSRFVVVGLNRTSHIEASKVKKVTYFDRH